MKRIFSIVFLALISAVIVAASIFANFRLDQGNVNDFSTQLEILEQGADAQIAQLDDGAYQISSGLKGLISIRISNSAILRIAPKTNVKITVENILPVPKIHLKINEGRIWVNTLSSVFNVEAETAAVKLYGNPGVYDIQYGEKIVIATAVQHSLGVDLFNNSLIIPATRQMRIDEAKLQAKSSTIALLKYSKLSKEFAYVNEAKSGPWIVENKKSDEIFFTNYRNEFSKTVRERGPVRSIASESFLKSGSEVLNQFVNLFTIDPERKEERKRANVIGAVQASLYALLLGNEQLATQFMQDAKMEISLLSERPENRLIIQSALNSVSFAGPRDPFFSAKDVLRGQYNNSSLDRVRHLFTDILDLDYSGSDSETDQKVVSRFRQFGSQVSLLDISAITENPKDVFFLSVELNDFLDRHPLMLKQENLVIVEQFEKAHLSSISNRSDADEMRQYFIGEKIKRLNVLRSLMEKGDIAFQDARKSILFIASQIDALSPLSSEAAVISYFSSQLKDLNPLIAFLRSTTAENLHGSFIENFDDFTKRVDEMKKVTELLTTAAGGTQISPFRREELAAILAADFSSVGFTNIKLTLPEVEDAVRVKIESAEFESNKIAAVYDTSRKSFAGLTINGEAVPYTIRLENIKQFMLIKLGRVSLQEGQSVESLVEKPASSEQSILEKVSRETLTAELKKWNIIVEDKYLDMSDFVTAGVVRVRLATIGQGIDARVLSFDIVQKTLIVRSLVVQTVGGQIPVNDEFLLKDIPVTVEKIYQRAVFEKERQDQIKELSVPVE